MVEEEEEAAAVAVVVEEEEWVAWGHAVGRTHLVPVATRHLMTAGTQCRFPPRTDPSIPPDSARSPRSDPPSVELLLV